VGSDLELNLLAELPSLRQGLIALPLAALLGAALAFRPRRRGTPARDPAVIQTQILLALVGAVIMLIVGASLARAFGIAGAASLIRYRSKIDDPKDAVVMLSTLTVGLASGVGLYLLASFATVFIMMVLWLVESLEEDPFNVFMLKIDTKVAQALRPKIERLLKDNAATFELRGSSEESLTYEVQLPLNRHVGRLSSAMMALDATDNTAVEWADKKSKK
jgi:uncharacterized membrane protein YhiD involved in acid resistance